MTDDPGKIHRNRLARMRRGIKNAALRHLWEAGELVRQEAQESIQLGAISGPGHIPSAPGNPPNADTGRLDKSIDVVVRQSQLTVDVVSKAPYSAAQEFGTSRIAPRPFMRPALQNNRDRLVFGQVQAANEVARVYKSDSAFANAAARYAARGVDDD